MPSLSEQIALELLSKRISKGRPAIGWSMYDSYTAERSEHLLTATLAIEMLTFELHYVYYVYITVHH